MMEKVQRFGGAMFTPVLLFSFSGIMVALCIIFKNPMLVGSIATEGSTWYNIWTIIENGAWTVFNQMELLFVIGLPIGLAKKANARAAMEAFVVYITCNYFISGMIEYFGNFFGVNFENDRWHQNIRYWYYRSNFYFGDRRLSSQQVFRYEAA